MSNKSKHRLFHIFYHILSAAVEITYHFAGTPTVECWVLKALKKSVDYYIECMRVHPFYGLLKKGFLNQPRS